MADNFSVDESSQSLSDTQHEMELDVIQDNGGRNYIAVTCGDILYLECPKRMPNSRALEKCVLYNDTFYMTRQLRGNVCHAYWEVTIEGVVKSAVMLAVSALKSSFEKDIGGPY